MEFTCSCFYRGRAAAELAALCELVWLESQMSIPKQPPWVGGGRWLRTRENLWWNWKLSPVIIIRSLVILLLLGTCPTPRVPRTVTLWHSFQVPSSSQPPHQEVLAGAPSLWCCLPLHFPQQWAPRSNCWPSNEKDTSPPRRVARWVEGHPVFEKAAGSVLVGAPVGACDECFLSFSLFPRFPLSL